MTHLALLDDVVARETNLRLQAQQQALHEKLVLAEVRAGVLEVGNEGLVHDAHDVAPYGGRKVREHLAHVESVRLEVDAVSVAKDALLHALGHLVQRAEFLEVVDAVLIAGLGHVKALDEHGDVAKDGGVDNSAHEHHHHREDTLCVGGRGDVAIAHRGECHQRPVQAGDVLREHRGVRANQHGIAVCRLRLDEVLFGNVPLGVILAVHAVRHMVDLVGLRPLVVRMECVLAGELVEVALRTDRLAQVGVYQPHRTRPDVSLFLVAPQEEPRACYPVREEEEAEEQLDDAQEIRGREHVEPLHETAHAQQPRQLNELQQVKLHVGLGGLDNQLKGDEREEVDWEEAPQVPLPDDGQLQHLHAVRVHEGRVEAHDGVRQEEDVHQVVNGLQQVVGRALEGKLPWHDNGAVQDKHDDAPVPRVLPVSVAADHARRRRAHHELPQHGRRRPGRARAGDRERACANVSVCSVCINQSVQKRARPHVAARGEHARVDVRVCARACARAQRAERTHGRGSRTRGACPAGARAPPRRPGRALLWC